MVLLFFLPKLIVHTRCCSADVLRCGAFCRWQVLSNRQKVHDVLYYNQLRDVLAELTTPKTRARSTPLSPPTFDTMRLLATKNKKMGSWKVIFYLGAGTTHFRE